MKKVKSKIDKIVATDLKIELRAEGVSLEAVINYIRTIAGTDYNCGSAKFVTVWSDKTRNRIGELIESVESDIANLEGVFEEDGKVETSESEEEEPGLEVPEMEKRKGKYDIVEIPGKQI